jgi:hypothetical protein
VIIGALTTIRDAWRAIAAMPGPDAPPATVHQNPYAAMFGPPPDPVPAGCARYHCPRCEVAETARTAPDCFVCDTPMTHGVLPRVQDPKRPPLTAA